MKRFAVVLLLTTVFACRKDNEKIPVDLDSDFNLVYGSTAGEQVFAAARSADGGYVLAGSIKGVSGNPGNTDAWVLKLDRQGKMIWQKSFGGSDYELAFSAASTLDGGYIIAGSANSNDGDISGNHGNSDAWVIKIDKNGNKEWQSLLGGSASDFATSVLPTSDGGYIMAGQTASANGDVSNNHGSTDAWVVKLDRNGKKQWQKTFGGTGIEKANSIIETSEGDYIMTGTTNSNDGDVTGYHVGWGMWVGNFDGWVVRLSKDGNLLWNKAFGGSNADQINSIVQNIDNSYTFAGFTRSNDFDVFGNHGGEDAWVVNIDKEGKILWRKVLGGSGDDLADFITSTQDGGYVLAGFTSSNNGDVSGNHGSEDAWMIKLDQGGSKQWQRTLGGSGNDIARVVMQRANGSFVMVGSSGSNDGDVNAAGGAWIVTIKDH
ncbi:T9SS C-terminal target domain-containing protein [Flavisolibacter ginsenosidimutans]|uniref:T9SS C-terminal target domain-containing protein n=1 Tax=Flavisolibacter ginsenosidimutans TaxID=661481 RepID=A0A5B8UF15_9BACT|nr:T9SS C-terminal target domain-containing protein [Flavisolibacter ginsenosidimutans]QEC54700.1 T9SS C-terminal target domain-containing protein [Flavisolibacter ginsenosidimutans]